MKKLICILLAAMLLVTTFASCGSASAETVSGSIDITLSGGRGATVEYKSISGRRSSALEYTVSEDKYILGDGACRMFARTTSGDMPIK